LSNEIFTEYEGVLAREKFKRLDRARVKQPLLTLERRAFWVTPKVSIDYVAKDPADKVFLECALEAKADFLITGNVHHFPVKNFHSTLIVTPSEFMALITKLVVK
jgi:putative PIN family toxin of toxin-antitoxin system